MLVAQQSLVDPTRAPAGKHTLWAYCHVPNGSTVDMTERHRAPDRALRARASATWCWRATSLAPAWLEAHNPNYVGGDIGGGANAGCAQFIRRPPAHSTPYRTTDPPLFLCSASTPPGAACTACAATTPPERCFAIPTRPAEGVLAPRSDT